MCGRFALTLPPDAIAQLFAAVPDNDLPEGPDYNVCPTARVAVVRGAEGGGRRLVGMRWGFLPHWYKSPTDGPLLINARAESIAEKPAFRAAVRERRCIVPATGFYEWTKAPDGGRLPWYFFRNDRAPLAFAAIWQPWRPPGTDGEAVATCALVTCAAVAPYTEVHHRMPVVLEPADWPLWLGEAGKGAARLMHAPEPGAVRFRRVDPAVNSNRASGPGLIEPVDG